jgi:hypothetical protein
MGRQPVVEITCSRCTRVEHRPMADLQHLKDQPVAFWGEFKGQKIVFDDLCTPCLEIVEGHWKEINKALTKMSPAHDKTKKNKTPIAGNASLNSPAKPK